MQTGYKGERGTMPTKKTVRYKKASHEVYLVFVDGKMNRFGNNHDAKTFYKDECRKAGQKP